MDQKFLKAQVKGKIKNLTANYGPKKFFWGPSKREIRKFKCELWAKKKLKAQVKGKFENLTANYGPTIFEGPSKRENQKLNCQLWTKKMEAQVKGVFWYCFFLKKSVFQIRVSKKMECPDFFSLAGFLLNKKWYQSSRIRAVSGPKPEISYFFILFHSWWFSFLVLKIVPMNIPSFTSTIDQKKTATNTINFNNPNGGQVMDPWNMFSSKEGWLSKNCVKKGCAYFSKMVFTMFWHNCSTPKVVLMNTSTLFT